MFSPHHPSCFTGLRRVQKDIWCKALPGQEGSAKGLRPSHPVFDKQSSGNREASETISLVH